MVNILLVNLVFRTTSQDRSKNRIKDKSRNGTKNRKKNKNRIRNRNRKVILTDFCRNDLVDAENASDRIRRETELRKRNEKEIRSRNVKEILSRNVKEIRFRNVKEIQFRNGKEVWKSKIHFTSIFPKKGTNHRLQGL